MKKFAFQVTTYGEPVEVMPTISKIRARLFYKYENRNGSYIDDEFAEKLLSTLPYAPLKGIYDNEAGDFKDHGTANDEGRIYGVVPQDPEVEWVKHVDEDGVEREYASCAVFIYSKLYKEANEIVGKSHSVERYPPSIKGEWIYSKGRKVFKFTDGAFFGLQVLGDVVEPCFEGAAFFTLYNDILQKFEELESKASKFSNGGNNMELNFKVSDNQKFNAIWSLLNDKYNEEDGWLVTYSIQEIYDDYALVFSYENNRFERVKYTKDNEKDLVELGEITPCYILDVTESEKAVLDGLRNIAGSYELIEEKFNAGQEAIAQVETLNTQIGEYSTKITEYEETVATLNTDKETVEQNFATATNTISELTDKVSSLESYKLNVENGKKQAIIATYSELLPNDIIENYTAKIDEYADDIALDMALAYELKKNNMSVFTTNTPTYLPKPEDNEGGLAELLSKYKKN